MPDNAPPFYDPAEDSPSCTPREIFARFGYAPMPPVEWSNRQLPGRLWELLYAAAARRFFFHGTDHVGERELYTLLYEQWLDEPTLDIPPEAETNTTTFVSEFKADGLTSEEIYLRYYADEDNLALWRTTEPDAMFPPHEDPPFDRDRFLPTSPIPLQAHAGWLPGDDDPAEETAADEHHESDPLGLAQVDRAIAADQKEQAADKLEARLRAAEPEHWTPPAQTLAQENIPLLPPAELTDDTLTPILWELLHNLALRGFYVLHTDHLTDRELYAELWTRGLRDPAHLPGRNPRGGWFHDILGSWGDDEMQLWLRYHATDTERAQHAQEWPNSPLPPKETPPARRDWRLPKGPF